MNLRSERDSKSRLLTRREALQRAAAGGVALAAANILGACSQSDPVPGAKAKRGGTLRAGVTGGSAKDTIDAHLGATTDPDIARGFQLYEPLAIRDEQFRLQMLLAESIEPHKDQADAWIVRLKDGIEFHNGKTLDADDVIFSINRIVDPKSPGTGASSLANIDTQGMTKLDNLTLRVPLKSPNSTFPDQIGQYFNPIVPVDYDPGDPVGSGPFKYKSFTPGEQSVFVRHENYWESELPYVDEVVIIDFPDDAARVNALLGGQVDCISNLPAGQLGTVESSGKARPLISETGGWQPLLMRVDQPPFDDVRVRQAFKLIPNRQEMIQQALSGQGRVANDIYAPFDPCYNDALPQREQDLDQAKALLAQAGQSDLTVELVTAPFYLGVVEAAQVFAEQAKGAGVNVKVRKLNQANYFGDNYLKWTFSQDFWFTRTFLAQVAQGNLPNAPYNQTHWNDPRWIKMYGEATAELNEEKRCDIVHQMQQLHWDEGGEIIWGFANQLDGYSTNVTGFEPAKSGIPLMSYGFKHVKLSA